MKCRVCDSETIVIDVLEGKEKNVTTLYKSPYTAKKMNIELHRCPNCSHMQIEWLNPENYYEDYSLISDITDESGYGMYTDSLLKYYHKKFEQLSSYAVSHNSIFDIGCGAGVLMNLEAEFFSNTLGIEPSKVQYEIAKKQGKNVINDYFSRKLALKPGFSAFTTTAVFEHIETIVDSLEYAFDLLENGGVGLVEVPNGQKMYFEQSYYDVYSDHVNYFTPQSLCTLAGRVGFEVISSGEEFNRNHISIFVRKPFHSYIKMTDAMNRDKKVLSRLIKNEKIGIWGIGGKSRSFIQLLENKENIIHIWDVNALTWGKYLDSTKVAINQPNGKEVNDCGCILIFAAAYTEEIINNLKTFGYHGNIIRFDGSIRKESV
jgi:SAM-dependent methyltransferase